MEMRLEKRLSGPTRPENLKKKDFSLSPPTPPALNKEISKDLTFKMKHIPSPNFSSNKLEQRLSFDFDTRE